MLTNTDANHVYDRRESDQSEIASYAKTTKMTCPKKKTYATTNNKRELSEIANNATSTIEKELSETTSNAAITHTHLTCFFELFIKYNFVCRWENLKYTVAYLKIPSYNKTS